MELKRVVVTGLGAVTPLGNNPEETWKAMLEGKSGAGLITKFDTTNFKTKRLVSSTVTLNWLSLALFKVLKIAELI